MPDLPPSKRPPDPASKNSLRIAPGPRYAELHCRTNFSFLEGASHPDELVQRAAMLGYEALAITDKASLAGVVRAHIAAKEIGLKLLIGAEITPLDAPPVVLLAMDRAGYGKLSRLITVGRRQAPKGEYRLTLSDVAEHSEGLLGCVMLKDMIGTDPTVSLDDYRDIFGSRCYGLVELSRGPEDNLLLEKMRTLAQKARVPIAAAGDVCYHIPRRRYLHDVLSAVHHHCPVAELGDRSFANGERHLKTPRQMREIFAAHPEAVSCTLEVADRCRFSLEELRYEYPEELCPKGDSPIEHLCRLTWAGAKNRYPEGLPQKVRQLIEHELKLIEQLRYEAYFLTVWDLVRFARHRGILCQGRGSAANSAVCYCLGVTSVDPARIDLLFERFVSQERDEPPDIDVDFEHERREEVLQYIYEKYGRERAGMTATVITYRPRSAIRDVGKALGLSLDRVDRLAKSLDPHANGEEVAKRFQETGFNPESRTARQLLWLVKELLGFPRHLSQHVGGMVMTQGPLCELVPITNASMEGRTVIEWDKDDLDALGLLKVDCLSLGMLTAIRKSFALIEQHYDRKLTLADVPAEDPQVYHMIQKADTMGVFQIESRAQMAMLPRLRPERFYDLVIEVAIVRPGPIQGDMVHPYLRRRGGEEPVFYPDERIREVLEKTLGVPLFQEQCMRLAVVAAGFTPGEADQLRRAMAAWRRAGLIDQFHEKFQTGMQKTGYSALFAEQVFRQIRGFGEYGFPESHAASFALLVYVSAWLKRHYPAVFTAALLNSQPMGFYAPAQLITDARRHGIEVRAVDVNASDWDSTLESSALRLGFRLVKGLAQSAVEQIVKARRKEPFKSFDDFTRRTSLSSAILRRLSGADAFGSLDLSRRGALWRSLPEQKRLPLFEYLETDEPSVCLPVLPPLEEVIADYRSTGLSLKDHPLAFFRKALEARGIITAHQLSEVPNDRRYKVAGLVLLRQRPGTANGITFVSLEDETGIANLVIRADVWERFRPIARAAIALVARGLLERQNEVIHLVVDHLEDFSPLIAGVQQRSRDFH